MTGNTKYISCSQLGQILSIESNSRKLTERLGITKESTRFERYYEKCEVLHKMQETVYNHPSLSFSFSLNLVELVRLMVGMTRKKKLMFSTQERKTK